MEIKDSTVHVYYSFDISNEIKLEKLEKIFGKKPIELEFVYSRLTPKYIKYSQAPYLINLGKKTRQIAPGEKREFSIDAKLYDFGVVTIRLSMNFKGSLKELGLLSNVLVENEEIEKEAWKQVELIKEEIKDVLVSPIELITYEEYTIFHIKEADQKLQMPKLVERYGKEIAAVLRSETEELSEAQIEDTLKSSISYFVDESVFVQWNNALVISENEILDMMDVLEYANIQLLELRAYDNILDKEIDAAYDALLELKTRPWYVIAIEPFSPKLDKLEEVRLDITQIIEKVENTLKIVGDPYLAKVYRIATERFRLREWKNNVQEKLGIMETFYDTISSRVQNSRLLVLEILIVLLFVVDIVLYLIGKK
ncbi:MAG: hypothetical protein AABX38_07805 [Candidatus Micrarchaeota archaeon]